MVPRLFKLGEKRRQRAMGVYVQVYNPHVCILKVCDIANLWALILDSYRNRSASRSSIRLRLMGVAWKGAKPQSLGLLITLAHTPLCLNTITRGHSITEVSLSCIRRHRWLHTHVFSQRCHCLNAVSSHWPVCISQWATRSSCLCLSTAFAFPIALISLMG